MVSHLCDSVLQFGAQGFSFFDSPVVSTSVEHLLRSDDISIHAVYFSPSKLNGNMQRSPEAVKQASEGEYKTVTIIIDIKRQMQDFC